MAADKRLPGRRRSLFAEGVSVGFDDQVGKKFLTGGLDFFARFGFGGGIEAHAHVAADTQVRYASEVQVFEVVQRGFALRIEQFLVGHDVNFSDEFHGRKVQCLCEGLRRSGRREDGFFIKKGVQNIQHDDDAERQFPDDKKQGDKHGQHRNQGFVAAPAEAFDLHAGQRNFSHHQPRQQGDERVNDPVVGHQPFSRAETVVKNAQRQPRHKNRAGRRTETQKITRLAGIDVEFAQPVRSRHRQNERRDGRPRKHKRLQVTGGFRQSGKRRIKRYAPSGRQRRQQAVEQSARHHAETHHVGQRIELYADGRRDLQRPCHEAVGRIAGKAAQGEPKREVGPAGKRPQQGATAAKQIAQGDQIGNLRTHGGKSTTLTGKGFWLICAILQEIHEAL